jgi:hypothetical protein
VSGRILPSVKLKVKSTNLLILSYLTNIRNNSEVEVSKKGGLPCLEDEWTKSVREKPQSAVTIGYGKGPAS